MLAGRRLDVVEIDSLMACLYAPRPRNHIVYVPGAYLVVAKSYYERTVQEYGRVCV